MADVGLLDRVVKAEAAARDMLCGCLGVRVGKALNLRTARGFDAAVGDIASRLRTAAGTSDVDAVRAAIAVLDIDWSQTTAQERNDLIREAMIRAQRIMGIVPRQIGITIDPAARDVVAAGRADVRRRGLNIGATFNAVDQRIVRELPRSQVLFVTAEGERRRDAFSERAREIVASGLERGLGRDDIADELQVAAGRTLARPKHYWEVVAGAFVARGRSLSQLSGYAEAGIQRFRIEAVLDEHTTETCRFLDGKVFAVEDGLRSFAEGEALDEPEAIKSEQPWVREGLNPETGKRELYVVKGGERVPVATVDSRGFGQRDAVGRYSDAKTERDLIDLGVSFPPYHGLCRTTTVPEL